MNKLILIIFFSVLISSNSRLVAQPAQISVDLNRETTAMRPIWAWFGYDEPNYTYMKDGKKLLSEIAELSPYPVYVRTHSLMVSGDGKAALKWGSTNMYTEDLQGNPIYSWTIVDSIFDTYVERGMKPLAQIGFMPEALSTSPTPYRHYWKPGDNYSDIVTGWAYPPKDYDKWAELVYQWVKHCVARYGKEEVESWYWEVWNEADGYYWKGTREEFFKLYDYSADAVKRALPTARVGGPNTTGGAMKWLDAFLSHCLYEENYATGKIGSPLDAILFHAKGSPRLVDGRVVMGIRSQLRNIEDNFNVIKKYPELKNIPVILGESDPEGCAACGMATDPQNAYRNGTMYSSYTAASFARKYELSKRENINLIGAVSWSFEFEDQPWFYGFRDLATNGVNKPVLNLFRMFGMMQGEQVETESNRRYELRAVLDSSIRREVSDIGAIASKDAKSASVMTWNYHDDEKPAPKEMVQIDIVNVPAKRAKVKIYLIDSENSNSYEVWKKLGSPQKPTFKQIETLEQAGKLKCVEKQHVKIIAGKASIKIDLERQAVALLKMEW